MEQKFGITHALAIVFVILGAVFLIAGPSFSPTEQVSNDAASTLSVESPSQEVKVPLVPIRLPLWLAGVVILMGVVGTGVAVGAGFYMLTRSVLRAEDADATPTDPLDWRSYGHPAAVILIGGLFATLSLFFLVVDILPVQASAEAQVVDTFFMIEFITISFIFGLVVGLLIHALLFFRARPGETGDGKHFHGHVPLELFWTITPLIFVMILGVYAAFELNEITDEEEGEFGVYVEGFQWGWRYYYPTDMFFSEEELAEMDEEQRGIIEATEAGVLARSGFEGYGVQVPEMFMRTDETVRIDMTSTDVLHAFWVPEFRMKRDAVPGVITDLRYTPILEGEYKIRCAEMCGQLHWNMLGTIHVVNDRDYDTWIENTKLSFSNPVEAGGGIWTAQCATCHSIDGSDGTGPTWLNRVGTEARMSDGSLAFGDYEYILESIWFPNARIVSGYAAGLMPQNYNEVLSEGQVRQIFAYMCSVSDFWQEADTCFEYEEFIRDARGETAAETAQALNGSEEN
jgi:cytochrome c oxidase subunit II